LLLKEQAARGFEGGVANSQDYCGILTEEAVRKNFVLVYELLDEVIDYGFPQNSSSEALKEYVMNEPTIIKPVVRPTADTGQKNT
jgi:hypothetical protein